MPLTFSRKKMSVFNMNFQHLGVYLYMKKKTLLKINKPTQDDPCNGNNLARNTTGKERHTCSINKPPNAN